MIRNKGQETSRGPKRAPGSLWQNYIKMHSTWSFDKDAHPCLLVSVAIAETQELQYHMVNSAVLVSLSSFFCLAAVSVHFKATKNTDLACFLSLTAHIAEEPHSFLRVWFQFLENEVVRRRDEKKKTFAL